MDVYQHFRPNERHFIDQVREFSETVCETYAPRLTDFLDPREQQIVEKVSSSFVSFFGGGSVERKRALLYPNYFTPTEDDFQISLLEIEYPSKFVRLEHRHILGALLHLGVDRSKYGDILFCDDTIQFVVASEMVSYVQLNFTSVGRTTICVKKHPMSELIVMNEHWNERMITVSSLRLDTIIAQAFHISRQKAQLLIHSELVKLNWKVINSTHFECAEGDTLSARGYGRCRVITIDGKTKKDKWKMNIGTKN